MPASRPRARSALAPYHTMAAAGSRNLEAPFVSLSPAHCSGDDASASSSPSVKKRRTPNAFFLFRSYMIANKLYPPELKHQNDVSCYVAEKWRAAPLEYRAAFFRMAEEKKRRNEIEGPTYRKATEKKKTKKEKQRRMVGSQQQSQQTSSQSHVSDVDSPVRSTPQDIPVLNPSVLSKHPPVFPAAPQPIHPIPPSLLHWGYEMEGEWNDGGIETDPLAFQMPPSSSQYVHPEPFHCNTSHSMALDASIQLQFDFGFSPQMDIPWLSEFAFSDVNYAVTCLPPFGTYLPS